MDRREGLLEERVLVQVDHTAPVLESQRVESLWVDDHTEVFVFFATDDAARGRVTVREPGGGPVLAEIDESFVTPDHTLRLPRDLADGPVELEIEARNAAGLVGPDPPETVEVTLGERRAHDGALAPWAATLAAGELGVDAADLDGDGVQELVFMEEVAGVTYGPARVVTTNGDDAPVLAGTLPRGLLPRAAGDTDGDGLAEVAGIGEPVAGGVGTYLFESPSPGALPSALVWADTTLAGFVIGRAVLDGEPSLLAVRGDSLLVYRSTGDAARWRREAVPHASGAAASLGTTFVADDLDDDGHTEVVIGDTDGRLLVYRQGTATLEPLSTLELPAAVTPRVDAGDLRGDGSRRVVASQELGTALVSEALYERRRHLIVVLALEDGILRGDTSLEIGIAGVERGVNALRAVNLDDDPAAELVMVAAPDLYVFDLGEAAAPDVWTATLHREGVRSRGIATGDVDGDGRLEVWVRAGAEGTADDRLLVLEAPLGGTGGPRPPDGLRARLITPTRVELTWNTIPDATTYRVHRSLAPTVACDGAPFVTVETPRLVDSTLAGADIATYRVRAVDALGETSACSEPVTVEPGAAPRVTGVTALHARAIEVVFSEPVEASADRLESYALMAPDGARLTLTSAVPGAGLYRRLLTLAAPLATAGDYRLTVTGVRSQAGVPLVEAGPIVFPVAASLRPVPVLYVERAAAAGLEVTLRLSAPVVPALGTDPSRYTLTGGRRFDAARVEGDAVRLALDGGRPLASGRYELGIAPDLVGTGGELVEPGEGDTVLLEVAGVVVYPNPWRAGRSHVAHVTLSGADPGTEAVLVDAGGREVARLPVDAGGRALLDIRDNPRLSSGIYVYRLEAGGSVHTGQLAIIR
jgi:hypothetical protein